MAALPVIQPVDQNGRTIPFIGYDYVNGQFVFPQSAPGVTPAGQPFAYGSLAVSPIDGYKASYSAAIGGLVGVTGCTDLFTLTGSATKTIRITRCDVSGAIATTAAQIEVYALVRSTANSGGTSTTPTPVPYDSSDSGATAIVRAYTANPASLGTLVGNVRVAKMLLGVTGGTTVQDRLIWDFGDRPTKALVLRGATQVFAINLNAIAFGTATSFNIYIEWTEE
jgi:hypothetical protein